MNRLIYDDCAYKKNLQQSAAPIQYILDPIKYESCNKCRPELGILGGTAVSHIKGNLVDLENDLRNQNRPSTKCPSFKWLPNEKLQGKEYIKPVQHPELDTTKLHLKSCQFQNYPQVPLPPKMDLYQCAMRR